MAHIKAEVLTLVCCNRLIFPLTDRCNSQDANNYRCDVKFGDMWETDINCAHSKLVPSFIERTYKSFEAEEHDPTWDHLFGCWDLRLSRTDYICSYLEIDGRVYCDVRGEYTGFDPRVNNEEEDNQ